jgi:hypothetical protein
MPSIISNAKREEADRRLKIYIEARGRYKNCQETWQLLEKYAERLQRVLPMVARLFGVRVPKGIILRPMYVKKDYYPYHGRAQYETGKGWQILMNIETCKHMKDKGMWVLDHEIAHVIDCLKHYNITHGKRFQRVYEICRVVDHPKVMAMLKANQKKEVEKLIRSILEE